MMWIKPGNKSRDEMSLSAGSGSGSSHSGQSSVSSQSNTVKHKSDIPLLHSSKNNTKAAKAIILIGMCEMISHSV